MPDLRLSASRAAFAFAAATSALGPLRSGGFGKRAVARGRTAVVAQPRRKFTTRFELGAVRVRLLDSANRQRSK
jgi:hypothetical protein